MQKDEHYVVATYNNWKTFEDYGFHRVLGFSGNRDGAEFFTFKPLWHDDVLHKKKKESKLWRIAMGMEPRFSDELADHKKELRGKALERKRNRIFLKIDDKIRADKIKWIACEKCHRVYDGRPFKDVCEHRVKQNKKIYVIELRCGSGLGCNTDKHFRRFYLVRPVDTGKAPVRDTVYTVQFTKYDADWHAK